MLQKRVSCFLFVFILLLGGIEPSQRPQAEGDSVTISSSNINVREGPGLSYRVVAQVNKGEAYPYSAEQGDWIQINLANGKKGWVATWLVSKNQQDGSAPSLSSSGTQGTVTTDGLRVRKGPGTGFQVIGSLNKGQTAEVLETNENWTKIRTSFGDGWISKDYLNLQKSNPAEADKPAAGNSKSGKITGSSLNVRSTPSLQGAILGKLEKGAVVPVISQNNGWTEIIYSGNSAWISSQYIEIQKEANSKADKPLENQPSANQQGVIGTVTSTSLNVRDKGNLNGKIIGSVTKGTKFQILEEINNWAKIEYKPGKYGWIANWFLNKSESSRTPTNEQTVKNSAVTILYKGTNLRKGPDTRTGVVQLADAGDAFPIISLQNDWYEIRLPNGNPAFVAGWIVSVEGSAPRVEKPGGEMYLKNQTIVLDPGHGGRDNGTSGYRGTLEKDLTLRTAQLLYDKLKASGANVILTRNSDTYLSLQSRISTAEYRNASAFVSIHYDSISDSSVRGMTSYYYHSFQKPLADAVHSSTVSQTKLKDRGVRSGDYFVLRETSKNAILLELGYLSNPAEEMLLTSGQFQEAVSSGIFQGLARYFKD